MTLRLAIPGLDVSRETLDRLDQFKNLVLKWTRRINLIAPGSAEAIWDRHICDSAQLLTASHERWTTWADLGSGGGFPGIVIATLAEPEQRIVLVESDARKAAFLRTAVRELELKRTVILNSRIEALEPLGADMLSARALAPLDRLVGYAFMHLAPTGSALFPKGRSYSQELRDAQFNWVFDHSEMPSMTDPDARILKLSRIAVRGPKPHH